MKKNLLITFALSSVSLFAQDTIVNDTTVKRSIEVPVSVKIDSSYIISPGPFSILPFSFSGYEWSSSLPLTIFFPAFVLESDYNKKGAKRAIKGNKIQVLFASGPVGPALEFKSKKDKEFQKKYHVEFYTQGCVHMGEKEDEKGYNQTIFTYLDEKYGPEWRFEIRRDAIGFEIPDSLIEEKVNALFQVVPVLNYTKSDQWPKGEETMSATVYFSPTAWLILSGSIISLAAIVLILRRKKKSK
jgi:hypothetical protein